MVETWDEKWRTAGKGLGWRGKEAAAGKYKQGLDREVLDEEKSAAGFAKLYLGGSCSYTEFFLKNLFGHPYIFSSTPSPNFYI